MKEQRLLVRAAFVALSFVVSSVAHADPMSALKSLVNALPSTPPVASTDVVVGTFNATTGAFTLATNVFTIAQPVTDIGTGDACTGAQVSCSCAGATFCAASAAQCNKVCLSQRSAGAPATATTSGRLLPAAKPVISTGQDLLVAVNAVNVRLIFNIIPSTAAIKASASLVAPLVNSNGTAYVPVVNGGQVLISVNNAYQIKWLLSSTAHTVNGTLQIARPLSVGYTEQIVPYGIIYAAPQGLQNGNSVAVQNTAAITTTLTTTSETDNSSNSSIPDPKYSTLEDIESVLNDVSDIAKLVSGSIPKSGGSGNGNGNGTNGTTGGTTTAGSSGDSGASPFSVILAVAQEAGPIVDAFMGTAGSVQTNGTTSGSSVSTQLSNSLSDKITTNPGSAPGTGDIIAYQSSAMLYWIIGTDGMLHQVFYPGAPSPMPVSTISGNLNSANLLPGQIAGLLSLDPFTSGVSTSAALDAINPGRFSSADLFLATSANVYSDEGSEVQVGSPAVYTLIVSKTQSTLNSTTNFTTTATTEHAGFLAFLGVGVTQDSNSTVTLKSGVSTQVSQQTSMQYTLTLTADASKQECYGIRAYYDATFASFPLEKTTCGTMDRVSGTVRNKGVPVAGKSVHLTIGSKTWSTLTGKDGTYHFRMSSIPAAAKGALKIAGSATASNVALGAKTISQDLAQ